MPVKRSTIGWTDYSGQDANFLIGCTPVSDGCKNCYARALIERRQGRDFSEVRLYPEKLKRLANAKFDPGDTPYRRGPGSRPMVFLCDLSDWCHPNVPPDFREYAFDLLLDRDDVDWQWLTKRAATMATTVQSYCRSRRIDRLPPHFWMLATTENQRALNNRIYYLHQTPAAVRGLSIEPMLEPMDLLAALFLPGTWDAIHPDHQYLLAPSPSDIADAGINFVITGAESGPDRRPFDPAWAAHVRDQCAAAGVAFFHKQGSHRFPGRNDRLDGVHYKAFPDIPREITQEACHAAV